MQDELISKKDLDNALYDHFHDEDSQTNMTDVSLGAIRNFVRNFPPVTPKQKIGHWIFDEILDRHYYCSECKSMGVDYWDYCPNCGAKMEGENK